MVDKAEFIAKLDGTLEEKIYQAFYNGFESGHREARDYQNSDLANHSEGTDNWVIRRAYGSWKYRLDHPTTEENNG